MSTEAAPKCGVCNDTLEIACRDCRGTRTLPNPDRPCSYCATTETGRLPCACGNLRIGELGPPGRRRLTQQDRREKARATRLISLAKRAERLGLPGSTGPAPKLSPQPEPRALVNPMPVTIPKEAFATDAIRALQAEEAERMQAYFREHTALDTTALDHARLLLADLNTTTVSPARRRLEKGLPPPWVSANAKAKKARRTEPLAPAKPTLRLVPQPPTQETGASSPTDARTCSRCRSTHPRATLTCPYTGNAID